MKRIVLAGGAGFLGQALTAYFQNAGYETVVLTRALKAGRANVHQVVWDGRTAGDWADVLEDSAAVINLVGRSVNCRYHEHNRRQILESRVQSTQIIGTVISKCKVPPPVWLNASTATIYRHTHGPAWDESGEIGATPEVKDAFSVEVATAWERALIQAHTPATRKVALRSAMVLGNNRNSVFQVLRRLVRMGLGGRMAGGRQFVSWIHQADFCRAVDWLISRNTLSGPVNICAPNPVTNAEMMKLFREICRRPFGLPAARWMLEMGTIFLQTETELVLKSRRVVPRSLIESGFEFRFPFLRGALVDLHGAPGHE